MDITLMAHCEKPARLDPPPVAQQQSRGSTAAFPPRIRGVSPGFVVQEYLAIANEGDTKEYEISADVEWTEEADAPDIAGAVNASLPAFFAPPAGDRSPQPLADALADVLEDLTVSTVDGGPRSIAGEAVQDFQKVRRILHTASRQRRRARTSYPLAHRNPQLPGVLFSAPRLPLAAWAICQAGTAAPPVPWRPSRPGVACNSTERCMHTYVCNPGRAGHAPAL